MLKEELNIKFKINYLNSQSFLKEVLPIELRIEYLVINDFHFAVI